MKTIFKDVVQEVITTPVRNVTELRQPGQWQETTKLVTTTFEGIHTIRSSMNTTLLNKYTKEAMKNCNVSSLTENHPPPPEKKRKEKGKNTNLSMISAVTQPSI